MNRRLFFSILAIGVSLVFVQGILSYQDGYLTEAQMHARGIENGWSFMEHGGMWADVFIITPIVAYLASKYDLSWDSMGGALLMAVTLFIIAAFVYGYVKTGIYVPEAHTHSGRLTPAGWIHILYGAAALWTCGMAYFELTKPIISKRDTIVLSLILTPFFFLSVAKFSARWEMSSQAWFQVSISIVAVWALAAWRFYPGEK